MSKITTPLTSVINSMENAARIPALRAITHSMMAKAIGAIRQDIRQRAYAERNPDNVLPDLDQRNSGDEDARAEEQIKQAMGFIQNEAPMMQASRLHGVYDWAHDELITLTSSPFESPLTLEAMLDFMASKAQKLEAPLVKALAQAAKCSEEHIHKLHELQAQRDREMLLEAKPEIIAVFNSFKGYGSEESVDSLPALEQHQLGIKVIESLKKAQDNVLNRVMRTRRITDLASLSLIEEGVELMSDWVMEYEKANAEELREAYDAGRTVRTLDEVAA